MDKYDCDIDHRDNGYCSLCEEKEEMINAAQKWAQRTVDYLYTNKEKMSIDNLEFILEELFWSLEVQIPKGSIRVRAKPDTEYMPVLQDWLKFNSETLRQVAQ